MTTDRKMYTILALDPGVRNCGWAVHQLKCASTSGHVPKNFLVSSVTIYSGHVPKNFLVSSVKEAQNQLHLFSAFIRRLVRRYKVDEIIAERFQPRFFSSNIIEAVNIMLGALLSFKIPVSLITAATWKNAFARHYLDKNKLKEFYSCVYSPHVLDALLIAYYAWDRTFCTCTPPVMASILKIVNIINHQ